ncbi:hypothetical protein GGD83_002163 [Rhodoblastus sphagnicola]|uniref:glycosyltransferase family 61 protein n=1 Tax=Rhodoblastus sphagnicola TaxID=333368 RepID=UPI0011B02C04|nr:glycosyltransferase family 61 protein [Rhodoblastus sphagnicola]MBB4198363.1 hypothetical protein [Rhodoblastus sphagnicola]
MTEVVDHRLPIKARPAGELGRRLDARVEISPYQRRRPHIFGPVKDEILNQRRWYETMPETNTPEGGVYVFDNAVISGGLVFGSDWSLVRESLINRQHEDAFVGLTRREGDDFLLEPSYFERRDLTFERCALISQHWDPNYGHWLIEGLPRMAPLLAVTALDGLTLLLTNTSAQMMTVYRDSLKWFGVKPEQLRFVGTEIIGARQLIYPAPLTIQPWIKSPGIVDTLEQLARRVTASFGATGPKKILIRRAPKSRRQLLNQDEVRAFFLARGYVEVAPDELSFDQQVAVFGNATHVVGVLGAECANIAFSPRGARFLGFAPEAMQDDFFWDLASHKDGEYFCLHGAPSDPGEGMNASFTVDPGLLKQAFAAFESA